MLLKSKTEALREEGARSVFLWPSSSIIDEFVCVCTCVFADMCVCGHPLLLSLPSDISGQKSAALLIAPSTGVAVDTDGSLKGVGLVALLAQKGKRSSAPGPPLIGQRTINLNREIMYQMTDKGQSSFFSSGQYGGHNYLTDTTFLKQSQASSTLSALHTWKTNRLYLDKANH